MNPIEITVPIHSTLSHETGIVLVWGLTSNLRKEMCERSADFNNTLKKEVTTSLQK